MKIKINNKDFLFFNNFNVQLRFDSVASTFAFVSKFNPDNPEHKELFKPLSFNKIEIFKDSGDLLLTGVIVNFDFNSLAAPELVKESGYSLGGVLEDSNIPYTAYPLESLKRSLTDIAQKLLNLFELQMVVDASAKSEMELPYEKSVATPTESVKSYLSKLTSQRNIVLSHNAEGAVVFSKPSFNSRAKYFFNAENTLKMSLSVKSQGLHSKIWVLRQPSAENDNLSPVDTIENDLVKGFRPAVRTLSSGTDTDTAKAVKNVLASELKGISVKIEIDRWLDLTVGDLVEVENKEIYLYNRTKFVISSMALSENEKKESSKMTLNLPEAYTGDAVPNIF